MIANTAHSSWDSSGRERTYLFVTITSIVINYYFPLEKVNKKGRLTVFFKTAIDSRLEAIQMVIPECEYSSNF